MIHFNITLPSIPRSLRSLLPSGSPSKILNMPYPSHPPWFITLIFCVYKLWSSALCSFLQPPNTSSCFGSNSFFSTLSSSTLSSFKMSDKVIYPHKTTHKIIVLYYKFWIGDGKIKNSELNGSI
jgi:hypothetical protein